MATAQGVNEKPDRLILDLVMFFLFVVLAIVLGPGLAAALGNCWYLAGKNNDLSYLNPVMAGIFLTITIATVMLLLLIITLIRTVVKWRHSSRRMRLARLAMIVLMAGLFLFLVAFPFGSPGVDDLWRGFREWARANADIEAIRSWAATLPTASAGEIPASDWPPAVAKLSPEVVYNETGGSVKLVWGGGFIGAYGIVVGPPTLPIPKTDRLWRTLELAPGAYVYVDND